MFARNSTSLSRAPTDSFGSKSANTPSCVSSVVRLPRSQPYSPDQKKVSPPATCSTSLDVHAAATEHLQLGLAEVVADRADDPHVVEERGGEGEMGGGATEHPCAFSERGLDGIERDRANDGHRHAAGPYCADRARVRRSIS